MHARALHEEVCRGLVLAGDLGPDAGEVRLERAIGQSWPVAPDRCIEAFGALRIHRVVDPVHPLDVRAEARAPAQVERHVHAQATRLGHRVDEPRERRTLRQRVVVAFGVELGRRQLGGVAVNAPREARRPQSCTVHNLRGKDRLGACDVQLDAA